MGLHADGEFYAREKREAGKTCEPESSDPDNGNVNCSNGNNYKSVCEYSCDKGFKLSDPELCSRFCDGNGWSQKEPLCEENVN